MLTDQEIALQKLKDSKVLNLLQTCGSDFERSHALEHFFYASDNKAAQLMVEEAKAGGYTASSSYSKYQKRDMWSVVVCGHLLPNEEAVNNESIFMLSLAKKYNATYDGWGTLMMGDDVSLENL